MIFEKKKINGVFLISPNSFKDKRGVFRRHFCQEEFKKMELLHKLHKQMFLRIN